MERKKLKRVLTCTKPNRKHVIARALCNGIPITIDSPTKLFSVIDMLIKRDQGGEQKNFTYVLRALF